MTILITGGSGFVGHHVVEHFLRETDWRIVVLDKLSYSSQGYDRLRDIEAFDDKRVQVFSVDLTQPIEPGVRKEIGDVDYILHLAAESHVDNSIANPVPFVMNNVASTLQILEYARSLPSLKAFNYFSTDEVFGPAPEGKEYKEWDRYNSGNPYAASKAAGEELALSYANTYGLPIFITHTMNVFGERQHPEKFIPLVMRSVLNGQTISIHANRDKTKAGSRFWIHGRNVAKALHFLIENFDKGEKYNIVGEKEVDNLSMAQLIAGVVGKELQYELVDYHSSRPGHDLRYGLDGGRMRDMGFVYPKTFEESLTKTIEWTLQNERWLE